MVRLNRDCNIDFYVGTDINGNKIPIPFEDILISGYEGTGKSMFVHNLLQDALLRYSETKIQFRVWSTLCEYDIWNVGLVTDGKRTIPGIKITSCHEESLRGQTESFENFLESVSSMVLHRYETLKECGVKNIWEYTRTEESRASNMIPTVCIIDEWSEDLSDRSRESFINIKKYGRATGVILIWVARSQLSIYDGWHPGQFCNNFLSKFVFHTSSENSNAIIGSTYCASTENRGVGRGMCIYQRGNLPYIPMDLPKFSYSLGKKIARALSQEVCI